jgi:adenosyl cobinamide kinase/adenosyl cobinamide phosphate guanylyltransferase
MSIEETNVFDIPLSKPKIDADRLFDPQRKQLKKPLPNTHATWLFVGKPRSGKSTYAFSLITSKKKAYFKLYDEIHIVMPESSRASLKVESLRNHKRVYDELTLDTILNINKSIDDLLEEKGKDANTLIIYDDVGSVVKDLELQRDLRQMSWNYRHRSLTQYYLLQTLRSLPLPIRKVATILVMWKLGSVELDLVYSEMMNWLTKKDWDLICKHVFNVEKYGTHTCLFIDVDNQDIYRLTNDKYHLLKIVGNE